MTSGGLHSYQPGSTMKPNPFAPDTSRQVWILAEADVRKVRMNDV